MNQPGDVLHEVRSWLPFDGDDGRIRELFDAHCAAVAELVETGRALAGNYTIENMRAFRAALTRFAPATPAAPMSMADEAREANLRG